MVHQGQQKDGGAIRGGDSHPNAKERKGKEIKAVGFDAEKKFAIFEDGYKQELGRSQVVRLMHDDLKPEEVLKGKTV
jgi:hypothetical protein